MAKMDYVGCRIMQGGDPGSIVVRDAFSPVSWPEVGLLAMLHGPDSVFDFVKLGEIETDAVTEKRRLSVKYGAEAVEKFAPGYSPQLVMQMPEGFAEDRPETDLSRRERAALRRARTEAAGVMDLPIPQAGPKENPVPPELVAASATSGAAEGFAAVPKKRESAKPGEFSKAERYRDDL